MPWKEVVVGEVTWTVAPVAERVANTQAWRLVLSCRCTGADRRSVWASTSLQSSSRSDLYAQADRMSDERVQALLTRHLTPAEKPAGAPA